MQDTRNDSYEDRRESEEVKGEVKESARSTREDRDG